MKKKGGSCSKPTPHFLNLNQVFDKNLDRPTPKNLPITQQKGPLK